MVRLKALHSILFLAATLPLDGALLWAAEGIISKVADSSGAFCRLKFPAIKEETLYWDRPVLKDVSDGDIIDFYGPCNYDPLGKDEVLRQRDQYRNRQRYHLPESGS
jgi:hypothetical protein